MIIYLADILYDQRSVQSPVPLNAGFVAAYADSIFKNKIEIHLFKSPQKLIDAINNRPPDILGMSNYIWNGRLNNFIIKHARKKAPNIVVAMGGPNFRTDPVQIKNYLIKNVEVDYVILFAGEIPFSNLIKIMCEVVPEKRRDAILIEGCYTLSKDEELIGNTFDSKERNLDYLPSPYLSGRLDSFLKSNYLPIFETNRGCPYTCSFCVWGTHALGKLKQFSDERVYNELDYVYNLNLKHPQWLFADANFGILKRDALIADKLRKMHNARPEAFAYLDLFWAKNPTPTMTEIAKSLKTLTMGYVAFQSLDEKVLDAIKRTNISTSRLINFVDEIKKYVNTIHTDLLVGLPLETYESNLSSYRQALKYGFTSIGGGEVRLLPGSSMDSEEHRKKYGINTKYRISASDVGVWNNETVFELEEVIRSTSFMKEKDMIRLRLVRAILYCSVSLGYLIPAIVATRKDTSFDLIGIISNITKVKKKDYPNLYEAIKELRNLAEREFYDTESEADSCMKDSAFAHKLIKEPPVKLNQWFATKLAISKPLKNEFDEFIKTSLIYAGMKEIIAEDLLKLCKAVRLLDTVLEGNIIAEKYINISEETSVFLSKAGYLKKKDKTIAHLRIDVSRLEVAKRYVSNVKNLDFKYLSNFWGTVLLPFYAPSPN